MPESAAAKIDRLNRSIARTGETITLQRISVDASGLVTVDAELTVPAHIRASAPQDLLGGPDVVDIRVVISSSQILAGSPAWGIPDRDQRVLIHGNPANIVVIAPIYYGMQLVRMNMLCRG